MTVKAYIVAVLFMLWAAAAAGQTEVAVGGGFHAGIRVGDIEQPASLPVVDARATRWLNDRWGMAGRLLVGLGEPADDERFRPTYIQALVQFRASRTERVTWHAGFGGGLIQWRETWGPHFLALETFISAKLAERVSLRVGVSAVVPISVHPVGLVSFQF